MAILRGGTLHGKVGGLIYYSRNGNTYARSVPKPSTKMPTAAQLAQRMRMKLAMQFLSPLAPVLAETLKPTGRPVRSALNLAAGQVLQHAVGGDYPDMYVDPRLVRVSWGKMPPLRDAALSLAGQGLFTLRWAADNRRTVDNNVSVILLVYNETRGIVVISEGMARRGDGELTLRISEEALRGKVHAYGFVQDKRRRCASHSVFLGSWVDGVSYEGHMHEPGGRCAAPAPHGRNGGVR